MKISTFQEFVKLNESKFIDKIRNSETSAREKAWENKLIKENASSDQWSFKTDIITNDLHYLNDFLSKNKISVDFDKASLVVEYELIPSIRKHGLDEIDVNIKKIAGFINWEVSLEEIEQDPKSEEIMKELISAGGIKHRNTIEGTLEIDSNKKIKDKSWSIKNKTEFSSNGEFSIVDIEIDFNKFLIEVV